MRTFIAVFGNNIHRLRPYVASLAVITLVTIGSIWAAVFVTGLQQTRAHVAYVTSDVASAPASSEQITITPVSTAPSRSQLMCQRYDASVTPQADGSLAVTTLRGDDFAQLVRMLVANPNAELPPSGTDRGTGVNVVGFLMMFLLNISLSCLIPFAEDREKGMLSRVAETPASLIAYLTANVMLCLLLMTPELVAIALMELAGIDLGFPLATFAGLMLVIGLLGTALSLLVHMLIRKSDDASMLGSAIVMLTSLFSGTFFSMDGTNKVVAAISNVLPQHALMDFATALQNGTAGAQIGSLVFVLVVTAAMAGAALVILRRTYLRLS
ncbi:MAG: ABC transporter permease [Atopobiaceae bacterium]|jgi:ABC-2 type transport system permease protein|nr:ABC transporter permease [Atopobiaceae bacterium]MCI2172797.1 ABC transporter permease [Atopobiaceae bacterium]MCI2207104.1 ABC transporter permease [Atopobiaceae bacterium]